MVLHVLHECCSRCQPHPAQPTLHILMHVWKVACRHLVFVRTECRTHAGEWLGCGALLCGKCIVMLLRHRFEHSHHLPPARVVRTVGIQRCLRKLAKGTQLAQALSSRLGGNRLGQFWIGGGTCACSRCCCCLGDRPCGHLLPGSCPWARPWCCRCCCLGACPWPCRRRRRLGACPWPCCCRRCPGGCPRAWRLGSRWRGRRRCLGAGCTPCCRPWHCCCRLGACPGGCPWARRLGSRWRGRRCCCRLGERRCHLRLFLCQPAGREQRHRTRQVQ